MKIRIDANMIWSVPAAIKWIRGLEQFDLQYVEQPVLDFDVQGLAQVRRSVSVPIAADEGCTDVRSALELIKADACDVLVVYPSEAGGLTKARQIGALADAAGKWCAIGSWAELGVATAANLHVVASSSNFPFASDTHYPLQEFDVLERAPRDERRARRGPAHAGARRDARSRLRSDGSPTSTSVNPSFTTTSMERHHGSVRSSDDPEDEEEEGQDDVR